MLRARGFRNKASVFSKTHNDVVWTVVLMRDPRVLERDVVLVEPELAIGSPVLMERLGLSLAHWSMSHLRARLCELDGLGCERWKLRTEGDARVAAGEIIESLEAHGLPWLKQVQDTSALVRRLRTGGEVYRSEDRAEYDADVWEGKIDPVKQPFVSSSRFSKDVDEALKRIYPTLEQT